MCSCDSLSLFSLDVQEWNILRKASCQSRRRWCNNDDALACEVLSLLLRLSCLPMLFAAAALSNLSDGTTDIMPDLPCIQQQEDEHDYELNAVGPTMKEAFCQCHISRARASSSLRPWCPSAIVIHFELCWRAIWCNIPSSEAVEEKDRAVASSRHAFVQARIRRFSDQSHTDSMLVLASMLHHPNHIYPSNFDIIIKIGSCHRVFCSSSSQ